MLKSANAPMSPLLIFLKLIGFVRLNALFSLGYLLSKKVKIMYVSFWLRISNFLFPRSSVVKLEYSNEYLFNVSFASFTVFYCMSL